MRSVLRRFLPTDAWFRWLIVPALVFIAMMTDRGYLADFWHHLARGQVIVEEGQLLDHDRFTFTVPGKEFQDVNWLTQVMYYHLYEQGGLELVQFVNALTLAITLVLLVFVCRRLSGSLPVSCAVGIGTFFGLWQVLTIRPQTFSLLLFVLTFDVLERSRRRPWLLVFPPIFIGLWANLHGAFPAGIMLIGCFGLASAWEGIRQGKLFRLAPNWQLAGCLLASLLATLLNPYGWTIYQYVGLTSNTAAARRIDEWIPPNLDFWIGRAWLISMILLAGLVAASWFRQRKRPTAQEVILIGCFLPLACGSVRMVAWWLLIIAPMVAIRIVDLWPKTRDAENPQPNLSAGFVCGLIMLALVMSLPGLQRFNPLLAARQGMRVEDDLDAVHARLLTQSSSGKIFTRLEWGEYLGWSYTPAYKVFMDGRIEIYPDEIWEHYSNVTCGKVDWERILDQYGVDALVLDAGYHAKTGLLPQIEGSANWQRIYQSHDALLYVRKTAVAQGN